MTRPPLACFLVLLVVTGCTAARQAGDPERVVVQTPATEQPQQAPAADDDRTPPQLDFTLPALDGGQVRGAELAGRPVAMWFWTPW